MATKKTSTKKADAPKETRSDKSTKAAPAKKSPAAKPPAKKTKHAEAKDSPNGKRLSAIDAAAKVLADTKQAMNCKEMIEAMAAKKLWTSPAGKTPWATLYSAIAREIATKGKDARFKKAERGQFAANG